MIHRWTMIDAATGRVISAGSTSNKSDIPEAPAGQVRFDGEKLKGKDVWLNDGKPEARPKLDLPETIDVGLGATVDLDAPVGSRILRNGVEVGESGGTVSFVPETAGHTTIQIKPPFPYQPAAVHIVAGRDILDRQRMEAQGAKAAQARRAFSGLR